MKLTDSQKRQLERNAAYWARREEKALKHYIKDEAEYDKRIKQIYSSMLHSVQSEINSFYGRYADKEGISLAEARKRVSKLDIAAYERKAKRYVKDKEFSKQANEEMRLYNATMKINRLEMLKANIGLHLIEGHDELEKFMGEILGGRTVEELERQAGILGKTVRVNAQLAHTIPNASFHHATFSDRVWMNQAMLKNELSSLLQTGMIQGKNPRVLARELEKKFDTSCFNAERLMRTEMARVQTEAQKQSYGRNGVEYFEFITNSGCCDVCKAMNGKVYPVGKLTPGLNAPPLHPHCRCSTAPWVDSAEYEAWLSHLEQGGTTASWNEFLKTLNRLPDIRNEKLKGEVESFDSKLQRSRGIANHVNNMQMFAAYTEYKCDEAFHGTFGYDPNQDVILYNPTHKNFQSVDFAFAVAHEMSHRMDVLQYKSWTNPRFVRAIESTREAVLKSKVDIEKWCGYNGKYEFEDGFQDIISALSKNEVKTFVGHDSDYWEKPNNVAKEVFANMSAIDVLDSEAKEEFKKLLKPIYEAYKEIVE